MDKNKINSIFPGCTPYSGRILHKRIISLVLAVLLVMIPVSVSATDSSMSFRFAVSVDGESYAQIAPGEEITVTAVLERTDSEDGFPMYAVSYNLWYNSDLFELVPGSLSGGGNGITVSSREMSGNWEGWTAVSASVYSSVLEGDPWENTTELLTFRLRAIHTGSSTLLSRNCSVSTVDGMDVYAFETEDAIVSVSTADPSSGEDTDDSPATDPDGDQTGDNPSGGSPGGGGTGSGGDPQQPDGGTDPDSQTPQDPAEDPSAELPEDPDNPSDPAQRPSELFADVSAGAWYEDAVSYVLEADLFHGTGESTFSPSASMTRAMLVTVLHRLEGTPAASEAASFADVAAGQWYTDAVAWADQSGIVTGYGNGRFGTDDPVTRQQLATVLYRYAQQKGYDVSASADLTSYHDSENVADWAESAVRWAVASGLIDGMDDGTLSPSGTATRAQVAAIFLRFAGLYD